MLRRLASRIRTSSVAERASMMPVLLVRFWDLPGFFPGDPQKVRVFFLDPFRGRVRKGTRPLFRAFPSRRN